MKAVEKRHILILNREQSPQDEVIASNALAAMVKTLDSEVQIKTLEQLSGAIPPETKYVFFYPDFSRIAVMDELMKKNPNVTFIMTTASAKDRSFNPNTRENALPNFKTLPRPFSIDTLKEMLA